MAPGDANWHTDILSTAARLCATSLGTHGTILDDTLLAYFYACHAELVEAIVPVHRDGAILGYVLIGPVFLAPADPFLTDKIARRLSSFQIPEQTVRRAARLIPLVEPERLKQTIDLLGELLSASSTDIATAPQDDDAAEARALKEQILAAINALSEKNRLVTTLYFINGYSHKEISDFLEAPVSTVKSRLHESRKKLQRRLMKMAKEVLHQSKPGAEFVGEKGRACPPVLD